MSNEQKNDTGHVSRDTYHILVRDPEGEALLHHRWTTPEQKLVVGRGDKADIQLLDGGVSRQHCCMSRDDGQVLLIDLDSKQGTVFEEQEIQRKRVTPPFTFQVLRYELDVSRQEPDAAEDIRTANDQQDQHELLLNTMRRVINSGMNLDDQLAVILESLSKATGAWRGFVLIENHEESLVPEQSYLSARARTYLDASYEEEAVPERVLNQVSTSLAWAVIESGEGLITSNAKNDPKLTKHSTVRQLALKSVMVVPIVHEDDKLGAVYLDNPAVAQQFDRHDLRLAEVISSEISGSLKNTLSHRETVRELQKVKEQYEDVREHLRTRYRYENIVGSSDAMQSVYRKLDRIIPTEMNVVIQGETGTGKELVARAIHYNGPRDGEPYVTVNCARFDGSVLESELFGHRQGAFTGADQDRAGLFEQADGGTLFLDEIGEIKEGVQAKLLRVIEEQQVRRLGENRERSVDVRITAATNQPIRDLVRKGTFREDLYYRLDDAEVVLPPLRKRTEDIPLLADHFLTDLAEQNNLPRKHLAEDLAEELSERRWPGNVRELKSTIRRLAYFTTDQKIITLDDYESFCREQPTVDEEPEADREESIRSLDELQRQEIQRALKRANGNKREAANLLGIHRSTLYRKIKEFDLDSEI